MWGAAAILSIMFGYFAISSLYTGETAIGRKSIGIAHAEIDSNPILYWIVSGIWIISAITPLVAVIVFPLKYGRFLRDMRTAIKTHNQSERATRP
jgi:hypothetical protein